MKAVLVEVNKWSYTERRNWLKDQGVEDFDHIDEDKDEHYTQLFVNMEEANEFIDNLTDGFNQYWFDVVERTDGDEVSLEYHNGTEWDTEIHITVTHVRVDESFIKHFK